MSVRRLALAERLEPTRLDRPSLRRGAVEEALWRHLSAIGAATDSFHWVGDIDEGFGYVRSRVRTDERVWAPSASERTRRFSPWRPDAPSPTPIACSHAEITPSERPSSEWRAPLSAALARLPNPTHLPALARVLRRISLIPRMSTGWRGSWRTKRRSFARRPEPGAVRRAERARLRKLSYGSKTEYRFKEGLWTYESAGMRVPVLEAVVQVHSGQGPLLLGARAPALAEAALRLCPPRGAPPCERKAPPRRWPGGRLGQRCVLLVWEGLHVPCRVAATAASPPACRSSSARPTSSGAGFSSTGSATSAFSRPRRGARPAGRLRQSLAHPALVDRERLSHRRGRQLDARSRLLVPALLPRVRRPRAWRARWSPGRSTSIAWTRIPRSSRPERRSTMKDRKPEYEPKPWERVEAGILHGPGYAVDLEDDEILFFVSPSLMGYRQKRGESSTPPPSAAQP